MTPASFSTRDGIVVVKDVCPKCAETTSTLPSGRCIWCSTETITITSDAEVIWPTHGSATILTDAELVEAARRYYRGESLPRICRDMHPDSGYASVSSMRNALSKQFHLHGWGVRTKIVATARAMSPRPIRGERCRATVQKTGERCGNPALKDETFCRHHHLERQSARSPFVRFMKHVDIDDDTGCWRWVGASTQAGYAQFWDGVTTRVARVWLHEQRGGDITSGQFLSLTCGNRMCVNPDHFQLVAHPGGEHNREKTHCPRGHEYDAVNTYIRPDRSRGRQCRQCRKDQRPRWRRG